MSSLPAGESEQGQEQDQTETDKNEEQVDVIKQEQCQDQDDETEQDDLGKPATPEPNFQVEADSDQEMDDFKDPRMASVKVEGAGADGEIKIKTEEGTEEPKCNKDVEMTELENDSSPPATPTPIKEEEDDDGPPLKLPKLSKPDEFPTREERGENDNKNHERLTVDLDSFKDPSIIRRYFRRRFSNVDKLLGKKNDMNVLKISLPLPDVASRDREKDRDREKTKDRERDREKDRERGKDRDKSKDIERSRDYDRDKDKGRSRDRDSERDRNRDVKHRDDRDKKMRKHSTSSNSSSSNSFDKDKDRRKILKVPVILRPKKESSTADLLDTIALKLKSPKTESRPEMNKPENGVSLKFQSFKIPKKKDPEKAKLIKFIPILKKVKAEFVPNEEAGEELRGEELRKVRFTVPDGHVEDHAKLIPRRSMEGPKKVVLLKDIDQLKKGLNEKDMKKIELADSLFMPDAKITAFQA